MQPRFYPSVPPEVARMMALAALRIAVDHLEIYAEEGGDGAESATASVDIIVSLIDDLTENIFDEVPDTGRDPDAAEHFDNQLDNQRIQDWLDQHDRASSTPPEEST